MNARINDLKTVDVNAIIINSHIVKII